MNCCGKDRYYDNFCSDCGGNLNTLPALIEHLNKMSSDGRTNSIKWFSWIGEIEKLIQLRERLAKGKVKPPDTDEMITLFDFESLAINRALDACKGNRHKAAKMLQISERTLYRWIDRLDSCLKGD